MTDQIAYQEYIQRRYNAFCKTVIRCAALDKILKLKRQWERQVSLQDFKISCCCESRVRYCVRENTASGNCPIPLLRVSIPVCLPLGHPQFYQVLYSRPWILPLLPDIHPDSAAQPLVPSAHCCFHACYPEVAQPAPDVDLYLLHHGPDISALTAGSQFFQLGLGFLQGLCVRSNVGPIAFRCLQTIITCCADGGRNTSPTSQMRRGILCLWKPCNYYESLHLCD